MSVVYLVNNSMLTINDDSIMMGIYNYLLGSEGHLGGLSKSILGHLARSERYLAVYDGCLR